MRTDTRVASACSIALRAILLALVLGAAVPALGQTCTFNANQPATANFGTIDPTLVTPATFSVILNFKCTGNANATFIIAGLNDSGPGAYRLKHNTQIPAQYMPYSVSTSIIPGTKVTLNGQIVASDYQNAYVGNYSDILTITILP
jgi:hypothetical protein